MSKKIVADEFPQVFKEIPIDEYFENNKEKLPSDLNEKLKRKLLNDSKFFAEHGVTTEVPKNLIDVLQEHRAKKKALKSIKKEVSPKIAYPNYDQYIGFKPASNTNKWIATVKDMYYHIHKGLERGAAFKTVTAGWDDMEKLDFKNWLKFYEENAHKKYSEASEKPIQLKVGQIGYWEDSNRSGYFVPIHREEPKQQPQPRARIQEIDFAKDPATNEGIQADEKREIIESQRNKIVSRLDSAEKLLRSHDGQMFAGKEFEALMHIIYELKKKIHTVNKISTSTKLYEDMIVREANILNKKGFAKASQVLFKIADDKALSPEPPPHPDAADGIPGALPGQGPGQVPEPNNPPAQLTPPPPKVDEGMSEFLNGLTGDKQLSDDLEVIEDDDNLVVEAQAVPQPQGKTPELEVEENAPDAETPAGQKDNVSPKENVFDQKMDQTLKGITIENVVQKLEDLTKIYKTREMPRQLAFIDIMLDHLGMASFFPTLAEATNKALDSNQYILTRLEDITSKLRGTVQTNDIDLKGQNAIPSTPELDATRNKLQEDQDQEKARKQLKKQQENETLQQGAKPEPELEVEEDLGGPVQTTNAVPPTDTAPAVPPAPPPTPAR